MEFNRVEYKRALTDGLKRESVMQDESRLESGLESRLESGLESKAAKNVLRMLVKQPLQRSEIAYALGHNQVSDAVNRSVKELSSQVKLTVRSQPFALTPSPKNGRGELILGSSQKQPVREDKSSCIRDLILVFQLFKLFLRKSLAPFSQIWEKGVWGMRAVPIAQVDLNILQACFFRTLSSAEIAAALGHHQLSGNLRQALPRLRKAGLLEYTIPDKPNSRLQKYRLTALGQSLLATKGNRHE